MKPKKSTSPKTKAGTAATKKLAKKKPTQKKPPKKKGSKKARGQTATYGLSSLTSASSPFELPVRQPGWFPDGADTDTTKHKRLFLEEIAGITRGLVETFPVDFDYTGASKKWILGSRIDNTKSDNLTIFIRKLAIKVRQYNASLYRLRRLHYYWDYRDPRRMKPPKRNPHGDREETPDPGNLPLFEEMVAHAEADWTKVNNQVNDLLERASTAGNSFGIRLLAADMIAANGYIVSMRLAAKLPDGYAALGAAGAAPPPEVDGSSSHVSVSSPFSSSSQ